LIGAGMCTGTLDCLFFHPSRPRGFAPTLEKDGSNEQGLFTPL
jgi:hypothetical protein